MSIPAVLSLPSNASEAPKWFYKWLTGGLVLLIAMVLLGGATRLYHAGLSIVEWEIFKGILPPLTGRQWQAYFDLYQQSSEYQHYHYWMTLTDFKTIFWFEYTHRLLGRFIGLWFLGPTLYINFCKTYSLFLRKNTAGISLLIIFQGIIGWYMVKSGLGKSAAVSHYRLALHLGVAFVIIGWVVKVLTAEIQLYITQSRSPFYGLLGLVGLTLFYGVFVAGLKAGLIYNTFPSMEGHFFPTDGWFYQPFWTNFFKNPSTIQFIHRYLGLGTTVYAWTILYFYKDTVLYRPLLVAAILLKFQIVLGISCLLTHLNFWVALMHQTVALSLWIILSKLWANLRKV